ncbi:MAG: cupredoxin domain-containing protein [Candidatus Eremiobacteraeota bacterium]|nr:cupredoxin domain-containing protein [Candidatus Eremiobacteraeota bacterium]
MRVSAIVLVGIAFAGLTAAAPAGTGGSVVNVTATAEQKFVPNHVVLHVNKKQTLRFTSAGGVHGIASADLAIPATTIMPGNPVSVDVTPKKAGTYKLSCTIVCGANHADMLLTVEVKP